MSADSDTIQLRPYYEQEPFMRQDKRYLGFISGVGAGKTTAGIIRTAFNALKWNPGEMGAIVAPTTTMVRDNIISLMRNEYGLIGDGRWEYKSAYSDEPGIHLPNGTRILILSANDQRTIERLAGLNLAWWWLDEAPRVNRRAFEILLQRLRVGDYQNAFLTGTPSGYDYTYEFFKGDDFDGDEYEYGKGTVVEQADRLAITEVPTHANPHTGEDYHQQMHETHQGSVHEQEIMGQWVEHEGKVYPWFDRETHAIEALNDNYTDVIYGVDFGFSDSPAVTLPIALAHEGQAVVLNEFYARGQTDADHAEASLALQEEYGRGPFYCDPSSPEAIAAFKRHGLAAKKAENAIEFGIKAVHEWAEDLRVLAHCGETIDELSNYHYKEESDEPAKVHDHTPDALRYALATHRGASSTGVYGQGRRGGRYL